MIKRRPNLSIEKGGTVCRRGRGGKRLNLGSHCRLFQTLPICSRTMLCVGYQAFPPCPDLPRCLAITEAKKHRKPKLEVIPESLAAE